MSSSSSSSSLCVDEAIRKRAQGSISEEQYLQCFIDHCTRGQNTARHGVNKLCNGDSTDPTRQYLFSNIGGEPDPFASLMIQWIRSSFYNLDLYKVNSTDPKPLFDALLAYRSGNPDELKAKLQNMDQVYGIRYISNQLCNKVLAMHALHVRNATMLKAVLSEHADDVIWPFYRDFDALKHDGTAPEIVRVVEESSFKSIVPEGKRFSDLHPREYMD